MSTEIKPGDVLALSGKRRWSRVNHVMIAAPVFSKLVVYEFTMSPRRPCIRTGRNEPVGVQAHYVSDFLERGVGVWHYPLCRPLYLDEEDRLLEVAESCLGQGLDSFDSNHSWLWSVGRADALRAADFVAYVWKNVGIANLQHGACTPGSLTHRAIRAGIIGNSVSLT